MFNLGPRINFRAGYENSQPERYGRVLGKETEKKYEFSDVSE
jgi:hypothetical protein